jgi:uncharacterized protein
VRIRPTIVRSAVQAHLRTHGLRGYDAVHLAAAHLVGADVFSSADRRLCEAAGSAGFRAANPIDAAPPLK